MQVMKWIKVLVGVVIVFVLIVIVLCLSLGSIVKTSVERIGPEVAGVPITLEKATISVLSGRVELKELVVGNPEGFKTAHAIRLGKLLVDIDTPSVFSDRVIVSKVHVDEPEITYEIGLKGSNVGKILENLESGEEEEGEVPEKEKEETGEAAGKKVQIDDFLIEGGKVRLSAKLVGGAAAMIPLPRVHLEGIGKESKGASLKDVIAETLGALFSAVTKTVTGSGQLVGKGVKALGEISAEGATAVGDTAKGLGEAVGKGVGAAGEAGVEGVKAAGDAVGKVGGTVGKGAQATGDMAVEGVKATGEAAKKALGSVGKGASKALGGLGGLIKKKEGEDKGETE